jgi:hypothetical protein
MTHDKFEQHEQAARDVIQALSVVSRGAEASPNFLAQVMARAEQLPTPRPRLWHWLTEALSQPLWVPTRIAWTLVLVLALAGAVPQYYAWLKAYTLGVPADSLYEARLQETLWEKNFACATRLDRQSNDYAAIAGDQVNVVVWACPSGDVLVALGSPNEPSAQRSVWIPMTQLSQPSSQLSWLVRQAFAAELHAQAGKRFAPMTRVLCQRWLPDKRILRRVQLANGQCRDEVIDPHTGRVTQSRPAACDPAC